MSKVNSNVDASVFDSYTKQDWVDFLGERSYRGHKINKFANKVDSCSYDKAAYQLTRVSKNGTETILKMPELMDADNWTLSRLWHRIKMKCSDSYAEKFNERIAKLAELMTRLDVSQTEPDSNTSSSEESQSKVDESESESDLGTTSTEDAELEPKGALSIEDSNRMPVKNDNPAVDSVHNNDVPRVVNERPPVDAFQELQARIAERKRRNDNGEIEDTDARLEREKSQRKEEEKNPYNAISDNVDNALKYMGNADVESGEDWAVEDDSQEHLPTWGIAGAKKKS